MHSEAASVVYLNIVATTWKLVVEEKVTEKSIRLAVQYQGLVVEVLWEEKGTLEPGKSWD